MKPEDKASLIFIAAVLLFLLLMGLYCYVLAPLLEDWHEGYLEYFAQRAHKRLLRQKQRDMEYRLEMDAQRKAEQELTK